MSLSAATLRLMRDMGLSLEQAVQLAEAVEADKPRSTNAERQQRYRNKRRNVTNNVTDNASPSNAGVSPKERSPRPPKEITPSPTPPDHSSNDPVPTQNKILKFAKPNGFERFWEAYPRKVGKGDARRKFDTACQILRAGGHGDPLAVLLEALRRVKPTWEEPQFIPHPATWLHQGRWEDEPELPPPRAADEAARHLPAVVAEDLSLEEIKARIAREAAEIEARRIQ